MDTQGMQSTTEVVKSLSIENLVNQRNAVIERIEEATRLIAEAEQIAEAAHVGCPRLTMEGRMGRRLHESREVVRTVDGPAWEHLLSESGMASFMDATAKGQWYALTEKGDVPPLTVENVRATFEQLHAGRGEMFERGVLEVFRRLSWDYKTNTPCKLGKKIILSFFIDAFGFPNEHNTREVDDIARVFHVFDGKPEPDHRTGTRRRVSDARNAGVNTLETDYYSLKWFKKGTAHLVFKRPELVAKMNQILAKHHPNALPPRV